MKQWSGLMFREWVPDRKRIFLTAAVLLIGLFTIPFVLQRFVLLSTGIFEITLVVCFICALISVAIPAYLFHKSLQRDLGRPDVWLHSTASIYKLITAKMVPSLAAGAISLIVTAIVLAIQYFLTGTQELDFKMLALLGPLFLLLLFLVSVFILCTFFFFYMLHLSLKPYLKSASLPVVFIVAFISARLFESLSNTAIYKKASHFGEVQLIPFKQFGVTHENGTYDYIDSYQFSANFFTGEIIIDTLIALLFFITASLLFEKKVRL